MDEAQKEVLKFIIVLIGLYVSAYIISYGIIWLYEKFKKVK